MNVISHFPNTHCGGGDQGQRGWGFVSLRRASIIPRPLMTPADQGARVQPLSRPSEAPRLPVRDNRRCLPVLVTLSVQGLHSCSCCRGRENSCEAKPPKRVDCSPSCRDVCLGFISFLFPFLRSHFFTFRQRGREGERKGEKHQCVGASRTPPSGDLASNPTLCPDR